MLSFSVPSALLAAIDAKLRRQVFPRLAKTRPSLTTTFSHHFICRFFSTPCPKSGLVRFLVQCLLSEPLVTFGSF